MGRALAFQEYLSKRIYGWLDDNQHDQRWLAKQLKGSLGWINTALAHPDRMSEGFIRRMSLKFPTEFGWALEEFHRQQESDIPGVRPSPIPADMLISHLTELRQRHEQLVESLRDLVAQLDSAR